MKTIKKILKNICAEFLAGLSRSIIAKYKPTIVMVTGSVGKTSTKDATAAALSEKFFLRKSEKSFNSEFGVPLTIIGAKNPWLNPFAWISVCVKAVGLIFLTAPYPKLLVLEVGADSPGDLKRILKIAKPDLVIVTLLPSVPVHVEAYENPEAVRDEEFLPAIALAPGAPLVVCADDAYALEEAGKIDKKACTYGVSENADVRIESVEIWMEGTEGKEKIAGMKAALIVKGEKYPLKVRGAIGRSQLYAPAAAIAAAVSLGMQPTDALEGLTSYVPPPGRGRIFSGKNNTLLIDDTYNSSPAAVEEILRSLELIPGNRRKVVVLGDMLELGRYSIAEHAHVGHLASKIADVLVTVGARAKGISDTAKADGMSEKVVMYFATSVEAAAHIESILEDGDIVLVKGSQGIRMERIVRPLLGDFVDVPELVRQDKEWLKR
jgi:UDP-N-acetylmuramoyl-tripeptide--D-alanyl-D-alanine ligase